MQDSMEENYKEKGSIKCDEIKKMGFDSHVPCYLNTGDDLSFCKLSLSDMGRITLIAFDDILEAIPTGCVVVGKCLGGD